MGDSDTVSKSKVKLLEYTVSSWVKWREDIGDELSSNVKLQAVTSWVIYEQDWQLEQIEEIEDEKERRDRVSKFEIACGGFIAHCMTSMTQSVKDRLKRDQHFMDYVSEGRARIFWGEIVELMTKLIADGQQLRRTSNYLTMIHQNADEKFENYAERFNLVIRELQFMKDEPSLNQQQSHFLRGFHPRHAVIKTKIIEGQLTGKTILDIADSATRYLESQLEARESNFQALPPGKRFRTNDTSRDDVIASAQQTDRQRPAFKKQNRYITCRNCGTKGHREEDCRKAAKPGAANRNSSNNNRNSSSSAYIESSLLYPNQAALDSLASVSLTNDKLLLSNVRPVNAKFTNANGSVQQVELQGHHPVMGRTLFLKEAPGNIASWNEVEKNFEIKYDGRAGNFILIDRANNQRTIMVPKVNDVFAVPLDTVSSLQSPTPGTDQFTISGLWDKNPMQTLLSLHERGLHSNHHTMQRSITLGHYKDVVGGIQFKPSDWKLVTECMNCNLNKDGRILLQERGPHYAKRRKLVDQATTDADKKELIPKYDLLSRITVYICLDWVFIAGGIATFAVAKPHGYLATDWVSARTKEEVKRSIAKVYHRVRVGNGIERISHVQIDHEKAVSSIKDSFANELGTMLRQPTPHGHERTVERHVRTNENRYRRLLEHLRQAGIVLTKTLRRCAWDHAVIASNFILNSGSGDYLPIQVQHRKEEYATPPRFGDFVVASVGKLKNKEVRRREVGIIVGFSETERGVLVKFRGQQTPLVRDKYRVVDPVQGLAQYMDFWTDVLMSPMTSRRRRKT